MVRLVKWELPLPYVSEEGNESWFTIAHNNHRVSTKDVRKVQLYKKSRGVSREDSSKQK